MYTFTWVQPPYLCLALPEPSRGASIYKKNYQEDKCGIRNSHCLLSLVIIVDFYLEASLISLSRFPRAQLGCNQSAAVEKGCVQTKRSNDRIAIFLPPSLFNDGTNRFWLKFELVVYMSKSLVACRFYFAKSHLLKLKHSVLKCQNIGFAAQHTMLLLKQIFPSGFQMTGCLCRIGPVIIARTETAHTSKTASTSSVERVDEIEQGNCPAATDKVVTMI